MASSSPEFRAISPPAATQEQAAPATAPRTRRQARKTDSVLENADVGAQADQQGQQALPANATPSRRPMDNGTGTLHSAIRSSKKQPGSVRSVRVAEAEPMNVEDNSDDEAVNPVSSPISEPLPRRARIRRSLLPRDQDGQISVKADVMEQRAQVIVTVATDAIQASLRKELADEPEEEEITDEDLNRRWEALDGEILLWLRMALP